VSLDGSRGSGAVGDTSVGTNAVVVLLADTILVWNLIVVIYDRVSFVEVAHFKLNSRIWRPS